MEKRHYNNMYRSKTLKEINEEVAAAPVEEPTDVVEEAPIEEKEVKEVKKEAIKEDPVVNKAYAGIVTGGLSLNVRRTPGGDIIKVLKDGERVEIKDDKNDDWYEINGPIKGFVMKKFIKLI